MNDSIEHRVGGYVAMHNLPGGDGRDEVTTEAASALRRLTDELHYAKQAFQVRLINLDHEHRAKIHDEEARFAEFEARIQAEIDAVQSVIKPRKRISARDIAPSPPKEVREIDSATARALDELLRKYAVHVAKADLTDTSKSMYLDFANCFVRWAKGDFEPGSIGSWKRPKYSRKKTST